MRRYSIQHPNATQWLVQLSSDHFWMVWWVTSSCRGQYILCKLNGMLHNINYALPKNIFTKNVIHNLLVLAFWTDLELIYIIKVNSSLSVSYFLRSFFHCCNMWVSPLGIKMCLISSYLIFLHVVHTGGEHRAQVRQVEYRQSAECYVNHIDPELLQR